MRMLVGFLRRWVCSLVLARVWIVLIEIGMVDHDGGPDV